MSNLHAKTLTGENFPTKKSFREAVAADPSEVVLTCYDLLGPFAGETFRANELPVHEQFVVPGPDPQNNRVWYANIRRSVDGIITVK